MVNVKALSIFFIVFGAILLTGGFVARFFILDALSKGIEDGVQINRDTSSEDFIDWSTNREEDDAATYYAYTVYNITNIQAVLGGAVPTLQEVGPYVYRKYSTKFNINFLEDGEKVRYEDFTQYEYQAALTAANGRDAINDRVYTFNKNYWALYGSSIVGAKDSTALAALCTPFFNYYLDQLRISVNGTESDAITAWGGTVTPELYPASGFFKAFRFSWRGTIGAPLDLATATLLLKGPNGNGTCRKVWNASSTNPALQNVNLCGISCSQARSAAGDGAPVCGYTPLSSALYPLQGIALILSYASENSNTNSVIFNICSLYLDETTCGTDVPTQQLFGGLIYNYLVPFQNTSKIALGQDPDGGTLCRPTSLAGVPFTIPGAQAAFARNNEPGAKELFEQTGRASLKWRKLAPGDMINGQQDSELMAKVVKLLPFPGLISAKTIISLKRVGVFRNFATQAQQDALDESYTITTGKTLENIDQLSEWEGLTNLASSTGGVWPAFSSVNPYPPNGDFEHYDLQVPPGKFDKGKFKFENAITDKSAVISLFNDETTRILPLEYREDFDLKGINTYKYGLGASLLAVNPLFQQEIRGVGNFSGRALGFQALISKPHFLDADTTAIEARYTTPAGYKNVATGDDSFIYVDPITGKQLGGSLKLQQSIVLVQTGTGPTTLTAEQPTTTTLFPSLIIHKYGELTDENASDYKDTIGRALLVSDVLVYVLTIVGFLMLVGGIVGLVITLRKGGYNTQTSQENLSG